MLKHQDIEKLVSLQLFSSCASCRKNYYKTEPHNLSTPNLQSIFINTSQFTPQGIFIINKLDLQY